MRLTAFALSIALSFSARADDGTDFGDKLKGWVDNDVSRLSRSLIETDYPVRVKNVFLVAIEPQLAFFDAAGPALDLIKKDLEKDRADYSGLTVKEARALQDHAIQTQQVLLKISEDQAQYALAVSRLKPPHLEPAFYAAGAYNAGIGNILAAYMDIGKQSMQNFRGRYPNIYVSTVTNADGNKVDVTTDAGAGAAIGITVGKAVAAQFGTTASAYVGAAITLYAIWKFNNETENFKRQQNLFEDALQDFPNKTMPVDEQVRLFKQYWDISNHEFAPLLEEIDKTNEVFKERLKTLVAWNASRLTLSRVAISAAKLQETLGNDALLPADRRVFETVRNQVVGSELSQLAGYVATVESRLKWACRDNAWLSLAEEYLFSADELASVADKLSSQIAFAPLHARAKPLSQKYSGVLAGRNALMDKVSSKHCASPAAQNILRLLEVAKQAPKPWADIPPAAFKGGPIKVASVVKATEQSFSAQDMGELHYCYTNRAGYGCGDPGSGFMDRFPNDPGNPMNSVGASAGYAGYTDFQPSASHAVASATAQIEYTVKKLKDEFAMFQAQLPEWKSRNLAASARTFETNTQQLADELVVGNNFRQINQILLGSAQGKIDDFLKRPLTAANIETLHKDANVSSLTRVPIPPALQRDQGPSLPVLGIPTSPTRTTSAERARLDQEFASIEDRVRKAEAAGRADPVFANSAEFFRTREVARMCLRLADEVVAERRLMSPRHAAQVDSAFSAGLACGKAIRYYAWGYSNPPILQDMDVVDWKKMKSHIISTVDEFITCNGNYGDQKDMMETPCNIFVGTALNRLYGVTDFGKDGQFKLANDIAAYVRSAPEWTLVGSANDQTSLDDAGMLAAKGRAVITVFANPKGMGHVNIVLPGIPVDKATYRRDYWGDMRLPRVANFHLCTKKDNCDIVKDNLTFADDTLDRAYLKVHPNYILIYVRDRP